MVAYELLSKTLAPLRKDDTGEQALTMMNIYHVKHLPIVENDKVIDLISEDEIMSQDLTQTLDSYPLTLQNTEVTDSDHLFEVISKFADYKLTVLPVIDSEGFYLGLITQEDLIHYYANSFSFREPGSIIVLETTKQNYSLAEISRIIEAEQSAILTSFLSNTPDSTQILVTLKLTKQNNQNIIAALERFGYELKANFVEEEYIDNLKVRYTHLMNYLDI